MPTTAYRVLQADGCRIELVPSALHGLSATCTSVWGLQLAFAASVALNHSEPDSQDLLLCTQQLTLSSNTAAVVAVDQQQQLAWCYKLVLAPGAPAAAGNPVASVCSTKRITLQGFDGAAAPSRWQGIVTRTFTAQSGPKWQLQAVYPVPVLTQAWDQQQVLGTFTAAAVLLDTAQHGTQQQQLQQLQQIVSAVCAHGAAAASTAQGGEAGAVAASSSGGSMGGADTLQALSAAAAGILATTESSCNAQQHSSAAYAAVMDPLHCSSALYGGLWATLHQQKQQQVLQPAQQQPSNNSAQPAALIIAATSSGQVWLCDPLAALLSVQQAAASIQQAPPLQQQQQQQQQGQAPPHAVKLLLDLQQPVVGILQVTHKGGGANALLLVGSLGRLVLLQQKQQAQAQGLQQQQQQQQQKRQAAQLTAGQQLQLPFQVAAAAVAVPDGSSMASRPARLQEQQQQQKPPSSAQPLLLLLGTSGRLYAASLGPLSPCEPQPPPAGTATATAAGQQATGASAAAVSTPGLLPLQPVHIPLPAPVSRLWTVPQQQQQSSAGGANTVSTTGTPYGVHGFAASASAAPVPGGGHMQVHSSIVLQLAKSTQLLEMSVQDIQATVAAAPAAPAAAAESGSLAPAHAGAAADTAAGDDATAAGVAVRAARQQLEQLMGALETLAAAKQTLEAAAGQQEAYLQGMQHDMDLLGLLQQQPGTAGQLPQQLLQQQQQQQSGGLSAVQAGTSAHSSSSSSLLGRGVGRGPALHCKIQLHGLWPVLGTASTANPSSSIHLALGVQLHQAGSSSFSSNADSSNNNSRGCTGRLGPGWQLVVSFVPESADGSSVQATVDISTGSNSNSPYSSSSSVGADSSLQASLMLPLPKACAALQQGGWIMVYAVKQPSGPFGASHTTSSHAHLQQTHVHAGAAGASTQQDLPPVVTLLGQQYISVLQLSSMASTNPAVQPLVQATGTLSMQKALGTGVASRSSGRPGSSGSGSRSAPPTYSCMLQLSASAASTAAVPGVPASGVGAKQGPAAAAAVQGGVKRPRHDSAAAAAAAAAAAGGGSGGHQQHQEEGKQDSEAGVLALQDWLSRALCLHPGPAVLPPVPLQLPRPQRWNPFGPLSAFGLLGVGNGSSVGGIQGVQQQAVHAGSDIDAERASAGAAVGRHGQSVFTLGAGEVGRASWSISTGQDMPSMQLVDTAAGAVAAGMKRSAGSAPAGGVGGGGTVGGSGCASPMQVAVQLQASKVPILASMHRAVLLDLLQQLEPGSGSSSGSSTTCPSSTDRDSSSGSAQSWRMVSTVPQLKLAAARLRQLHQHLLKLLDTADQTQDMLQGLQPLSPAAVVAGQPSCASDGSTQAAAGANAVPDDAEQQIAFLMELSAGLHGLEQGLFAAYGRFLLAVSDAVQVKVSAS